MQRTCIAYSFLCHGKLIIFQEWTCRATTAVNEQIHVLSNSQSTYSVSRHGASSTCSAPCSCAVHWTHPQWCSRLTNGAHEQHACMFTLTVYCPACGNITQLVFLWVALNSRKLVCMPMHLAASGFHSQAKQFFKGVYSQTRIYWTHKKKNWN